ncbi:E3 ubiquitin-protein ligase MIB2-like isoform X2 [Dermacentor variabilis]|uniref:E3 ubiquitin-protein ligase MIB2-like isoform X2 n=1 Tax=Dermacentor variabilis TaxID=34621 RepID=UPI003F5C5B5C
MGSGQSTSAAPLQEITRFKVGDRVAVTMDVENFRLLQNDYGGWEAQMSLIFGNVGIVQKLLPSGGLMVHYKVANATWQLNPTAVEKLIAYKRGDKVRVCVNLETLKEFQKGHGGYNERMQTSIGKVGVVVRCEPNFDVSVRICGAVWNYNPLCLEAAPKSSIDSSGSSSSTDSIESSGDGTDILTDRIGGLLRLAERVDELAQMVQRRSLEESPLHAACYHGDEELARTLIHAGNNVNARDKDGDTPLHYCAYGNEPGAMRLLVTAGADLNAVNEKNRTPLHIAASKEHADCVRTLLSYGSRIKVNLQDVAGDTALHDAITVGSAEIASLLINFRTMDLSITNQRGFNTLHHACLKGNNLIVERILSKRPNLLNVAKNDGFTALHLAANNGHLRVAKTLLAKRQCDINAHASKGETPLMLAAFFGHWDILELLVESGADINRQDQDGDTVLHFSIARHQLRKLQTSGTANAPNVSAIERELPNGRLAPLCYLANRGADVYMMNNKGITPLMLAAGFDISEHVVAWASRRWDSCQRQGNKPEDAGRTGHSAERPRGPAHVRYLHGEASRRGLSLWTWLVLSVRWESGPLPHVPSTDREEDFFVFRMIVLLLDGITRDGHSAKDDSLLNLIAVFFKKTTKEISERARETETHHLHYPICLLPFLF